MKRLLALIIIFSSFSTFANEDLIMQLDSMKILCNLEDQVTEIYTTRLEKDPENKELIDMLRSSLKMSIICTMKAEKIASNNNCEEAIDEMLSNQVCTKEKKALDLGLSLYKSEPTKLNKDRSDKLLEESNLCATRAYSLCD